MSLGGQSSDRVDAMAAVMAEVRNERSRQEQMWGEQNHPQVGVNREDYGIFSENLCKEFCEDATRYGGLTWAHVLIEEVSEYVHSETEEDQRRELVQVAAVAIAAIESLDRNSRMIPRPDQVVGQDAPNDKINSPSHYTKGIECADYIESHGMDFFQGNAVKYLTRYKHKGAPVEDLEKAKWYLNRLIEAEKKLME